MKSKQFVGMAAWLALVVGGAAYGQFTPGHVFVSYPATDFCSHGIKRDQIWEIDPETGDASLFAELSPEECGFLSGLAFTPDGTRLRASLWIKQQILEFDAQGNMSVALDSSDGITGPRGTNNMTYHSNGDFYVVAGASRIMRFPPGGGAGTIFADSNDGLISGGPIAFTADGDLYFGNQELGNFLLRITPEGDASLFEDYGNTLDITAITSDDAGNLYVGVVGTVTNEIYRYDAANPWSKTVLASGGPFVLGFAMAMSPDQTQIYVATTTDELFALDPVNGAFTLLADLTQEGVSVPAGIAVAPPPGPIPAVSAWGMITMTLALFTAGTLLIMRRRAGEWRLRKLTAAGFLGIPRCNLATKMIPWKLLSGSGMQVETGKR